MGGVEAKLILPLRLTPTEFAPFVVPFPRLYCLVIGVFDKDPFLLGTLLPAFARFPPRPVVDSLTLERLDLGSWKCS
jgi:hypothetical protein